HFQLRLLPQPLLRYEPGVKDIVDGALFAFSLGTDPEAILVLEAHQAGVKTEWEYAFARFHFIDIKAAYKGREVWHVPLLPDIASLDIGATQYMDSAYTTYHVDTEKAEK